MFSGFQVAGETVRKPHKVHKEFIVSAVKVPSRKRAIFAGQASSELVKKHSHLAPKDSHAIMVGQTEELADILIDNRHRFPKKPLAVTHLRTVEWYKDLLGLTSGLGYATANLTFDFFKKKLKKLKKLNELD